MLRLIFLLIALYFVFKLFLAPRKLSGENRANVARNKNSRENQMPEVLVSCPVCGTFFQKSRALTAHGQMVCSPKCAKEKT